MNITLATLHQATAQQVFDQVATHLLKQNALSATQGGCSYRGDGGLMCAAGCLISNEEMIGLIRYNTGYSWKSMISHNRVPFVHSDLITELQKVHDCSYVDSWLEELSGVAERRGLNQDVITSFSSTSYIKG